MGRDDDHLWPSDVFVEIAIFYLPNFVPVASLQRAKKETMSIAHLMVNSVLRICGILDLYVIYYD